MDLKELKEIINDSNNKAIEEGIYKEKKFKASKEHSEAKDSFEDVLSNVRAFDAYKEFIEKNLPETIKKRIYANRNKPGSAIDFSLEVIGMRNNNKQDFICNNNGNNVITLNEQDFEKFINLFESFLNEYKIENKKFVHSNYSVVYVVYEGLMKLFYAYTLENEHGLSYLEEKFNCLLEEYGLNINSKDKIKKLSINK